MMSLLTLFSSFLQFFPLRLPRQMISFSLTFLVKIHTHVLFIYHTLTVYLCISLSMEKISICIHKCCYIWILAKEPWPCNIPHTPNLLQPVGCGSVSLSFFLPTPHNSLHARFVLHTSHSFRWFSFLFSHFPVSQHWNSQCTFSPKIILVEWRKWKVCSSISYKSQHTNSTNGRYDESVETFRNSCKME